FTYRGAVQDTSIFDNWINACAIEESYCLAAELKRSVVQPVLTFVPNPATNHTTVHFYSDYAGDALVKVVDKVTGRALYSKTIKIEAMGEQKVDLDLTHLKENVYSVQVIMESKVIYGHLLVK